MCITSGPAKLSKTKILSLKLDEEYHLLAYSNNTRNLSDHPNSMILAVPGKLTQEDFFDTTLYAKFLEEIEEFNTPRTRSLGKSKSIDDDTLSFENFQLGMYNVFLSNSADLIGEAVSALPENERPVISSDLLDFFKTHYVDWSYIVCVFDNKQAIDAQPIMFKYKPFDKNILFFPAMDSHSGKAPVVNSNVAVDHVLIYEDKGNGITEFPEECQIPDFLKNKEYNCSTKVGARPNGDWYLKFEEGAPVNISQLIRTADVIIKNPEYQPES